MYDSRQLLQFAVDRNLGFDYERDLGFDPERSLFFDSERDLSFDCERDLPFGIHGPVFRGQACPNCKNLIHPIEGQCRACGTKVTPMRSITRTKKRPKRSKEKVERAEEVTALQICPNCSFKIPADAVYCPRCRVKVDEWKKYIQDLRKWEQQVARTSNQPQRYDQSQYYDYPDRRR